MSDVEQRTEQEIETCSVFDEGANTGKSRCCNITLRIIFSTPGLVLLVIIYSVIGALIFPLLEATGTGQAVHGVEAVSSGGGGGGGVSISKSREDCLKELWTITGN